MTEPDIGALCVRANGLLVHGLRGLAKTGAHGELDTRTGQESRRSKEGPRSSSPQLGLCLTLTTPAPPTTFLIPVDTLVPFMFWKIC
jgi:hypothetical protein